MSKYKTGKYVITLFDERGAKIDQFSVKDGGLLAAQKLGYDLIRDAKCASFNIHRNAFNSMDPKGPW